MNDVAPPRAGRREWIGLGVIALPCMLYSMDLTVLNLAVPHMTEELRPTSSQLLWIVDIYGFVLAGLLITMGTLGDRIGRRRLLLIGAAAFGVASVLAAFSTSAPMLIVARAALGVAGATLAPSTLSLIRSMFVDPHQRTVAIGVWITSYSVGGAIGPVVGGILLTYFWWGSVFLIGVPVMLLLLVVGPILLPEYRDPKAGRMDLPSVALSLAAVLLVIYGIKQVAQGTADRWAALAIVASIVAGVAFVGRQQRLADPLIDLRLFRLPSFSIALGAYTLGTFIAFGLFLLESQYLQLILGLSPLHAGLWMLPFSGAFISGSMLTPVLARRIRPPVLMAAGLGVAALGCLLLTRVGPTGGLVPLVAGFTIYSLGLAPVFTLATDLIVGSAPTEHAGAAAAISETGSELGGALGIALLGSAGTAVYRAAMSHGMPIEAGEVARSTLGGAMAVAAHLPSAASAELVSAAREAFSLSLQVAASICVVIAVAAGLAVAMLVRRPAGERRAPVV